MVPLALWAVVMQTIIFHGVLYLCPVSGRKAGEGKKVTHSNWILMINVNILRHKIVQSSLRCFLPEEIVTWRITSGRTEKNSACFLFFGGRVCGECVESVCVVVFSFLHWCVSQMFLHYILSAGENYFSSEFQKVSSRPWIKTMRKSPLQNWNFKTNVFAKKKNKYVCPLADL